MDQSIRPENDIESGSRTSSKWDFFGKILPKSEIVFFTQIIIIYIVIIVSIVNLTLDHTADKLWIALLSSSIGYILPNPKIKIKS
jgi:hypothetical protein